MITSEPVIKVALLQNSRQAKVLLNGTYPPFSGQEAKTQINASSGENGTVILRDRDERIVVQKNEIELIPADRANDFFSLSDIRIGIRFHWERLQTLSFRGGILFSPNQDGTISVFNLIGLEDYLSSVISSEMSAGAPPEFLKVQAVTARSWLVAMLEKKKTPRAVQGGGENEILVWQDVNDHEGFDVCADDHCQRYQGIARIISENVARAINDTRGPYLRRTLQQMLRWKDGSVCHRLGKCPFSISGRHQRQRQRQRKLTPCHGGTRKIVAAFQSGSLLQHNR
ncbi:MAG TPA: SpoIID/LytB domain-containing protein [Smithellaceae bacterium]|nr:SpoIID/LytB domain-containing protein [Smithellaceae bacterium]